MRKGSAFALGLAAPLLVAACGGVAAPGKPTGTAPAARCPAAAPRIEVRSPVPTHADLVPPGPIVATVCQYLPGVPSLKTRNMQRRVVLRGLGASGFAAVLDSVGPAGQSLPRCVRPWNVLPPVQEVTLGYRSLRSQLVQVVFSECDLAIVTAGGHTGVLSQQTESDLFGYTSPTLGARGPLTPDLIGLTGPAATAVIRERHFSISFDGAVIDENARFGSIVFQVPPPGAFDAGPGQQVDVLLAVHGAPACRAAQLALSYTGGGASAGNDFGSVIVRDSSARPCTLTGPLLVTGTGPGGRADTSTVRFRLSGVTVLSPGAGSAAAAGSGNQAGGLVGVLGLAAEYRDGPTADGLCSPEWVVPAGWRVGYPDGQARIVANADPRDASRLVRSGGLVTCRGQLDTPAPAYVGTPPGP
jgi:hypothetical protein